MRVTPGMRASVSPRAGQTIREMRKGAPEKLILEVQSGYVVVRNDDNGNYSLLRRKTLWNYEVTRVPERTRNPIRIIISHDGTGEQREWWMSENHLRLIHRALKAHPKVAAYMADRFDFTPLHRRRRRR